MMPDREKVIRAIEYCLAGCSEKCPYFDSEYCCLAPDGIENKSLLCDALELLKAQEPKPPIVKENAYGWKFFYCPSCGREFNANRKHGRVNEENFCDKCGQAVKWPEPPKEGT